ncbi:MAG: hypothetical protein ACE37J_21350 [Pikeienuella sp.]|uniref:hypothetical protein n=1 Tax=Pikeienuella sp. TaxID=2831957 RepID=UPI0039191B05
MIARAILAATGLLVLAPGSAHACRVTGDELLNPAWIGARSDRMPDVEVEIVGFVTSVEHGETRLKGLLTGRPWVIRVETIRTVRGERRPNWSVALLAPLDGYTRPDFGEGAYRFAFDLPETDARDSAPSPVRETRIRGSDVALPQVGMRLCGQASVFPVSPYSPDVLLARAVGASAAPFVAGLSGLGLLAGAAALLRRRWRRA